MYIAANSCQFIVLLWQAAGCRARRPAGYKRRTKTASASGSSESESDGDHTEVDHVSECDYDDSEEFKFNDSD